MSDDQMSIAKTSFFEDKMARTRNVKNMISLISWLIADTQGNYRDSNRATAEGGLPTHLWQNEHGKTVLLFFPEVAPVDWAAGSDKQEGWGEGREGKGQGWGG